MPEAYWTSNWDKNERRKNSVSALRYLKRNKLDLMFAFGTWAGQDMAFGDHSIPTLIMSVRDPIRAGLVNTNADTTYDHIHTRVDIGRQTRHVELFHSILEFKKMGMAFEYSEDGRLYSGYEPVKKLSVSLGFELVTCNAIDNNCTKQEAYKALKKCYGELIAKNIDVLYLTIHRGKTLETLPKLLKNIKIPTYTQPNKQAFKEVKLGVLFSMSQQSAENMALFHTKAMIKVLNGSVPSKLSMTFVDPLKIIVNTNTARMIKYKIPDDILDMADIVY